MKPRVIGSSSQTQHFQMPVHSNSRVSPRSPAAILPHQAAANVPPSQPSYSTSNMATTQRPANSGQINPAELMNRLFENTPWQVI